MRRKRPLERFEAIAQRLVEGSLGRLLGGRLDPLLISAEIANAIEDQQRNGYAPNQFVIQLHPTDFSYLRVKWPETANVLANYVVQIAQQLNLRLASDPHVDVIASPDIARQFAHVHATHSATEVSEATAVYTPVRRYDPLIALRQKDAFLIRNGRTHIALDRPKMTIGRNSECEIVLDDRTISRRHAQIRWRFGRFILYDLGSRGGTYVNGQPITEWVLRPNDVIRIADDRLIYGEGLHDKQEKPPSLGSQITRMMPRRENS